MPIYEYECDGCGEVFEVMQKISDPPPKKHSCGSTKVHRIMSQTSFILKGSGWYITDYGRKDQGGNNGHKASKNGDSDTPPSSADKKQKKTTKTETSKPKSKSAG